MSTLVRLFVVVVPLAVIVVGLFQLNSLRTVPGRLTRTPVILAFSFGATVALVVEVALAGLAGMDVGVGTEQYVFALPYALGAGGAVFLAGLAGYGILERAYPSRRIASLGIFVVPVALGLSMQVISDFAGTIEDGERSATSQREQAHVRDLCSTLTLRVDVVAVDFGAGNGIDRLTIDLVFMGADDVTFEPGGFMTANEDASVMILPDLFSKLTTDLPIVLKTGQPSTYPVVLVPRQGEGKPHAGTWQSEVWLTRTDGETYACPVPFVVSPKAG